MVVFKRSAKIEQCLDYIQKKYHDQPKILKRIEGLPETEFYTMGQLLTLVNIMKNEPENKKLITSGQDQNNSSNTPNNNNNKKKKKKGSSGNPTVPIVTCFEDLVGENEEILDEMPDPKREEELSQYDPCVRDQLLKIRKEVEDREYRKWVADVAPDKIHKKRWFQPGEWFVVNQYMSVGVNIIISMISMFVVGWYLGEKSFGRTGGILFGLVCAVGIMVVEIWLYLLREQKMEMKIVKAKERRQKKLETFELEEKKNK